MDDCLFVQVFYTFYNLSDHKDDLRLGEGGQSSTVQKLTKGTAICKFHDNYIEVWLLNKFVDFNDIRAVNWV